MGNPMKIIIVLVFFLMVLSVSVAAEEGSDDKDAGILRDGSGSDAAVSDEGRDDARIPAEPEKQMERRAADAGDAAAERLAARELNIAERRSLADLQKREKLRELQQDRLEKLARLDREKQEKLEGLRAEQIERLTEVKEERLRKMAGLDQEHLEKIAALDKEQVERLAALDRERMREYSALSESDLKERLAKVEVRRIDASQLFKERIITKEQREAAREQEREAQEQRTELRIELKTQREQLLQAAREESPEMLSRLREYIAHAIDVALKHLELLKGRINAKENIPEAEAQDILAQIDERIASLTELRAKTEAASTVDEAKAAGREFASSWKDLKIRFRQDEVTLIRAGVHEIIGRSEHLERKLDKALARMEEKGIDVSEIDAQVDAFSKKIAEAREKFKESQAMFAAAKALSGEEGAAKVQEARSLAKEAHQLLKEAHELLKAILQGIRQAGGEAEADEVEAQEVGEVEIVEVEAEAEIEEEAEDE